MMKQNNLPPLPKDFQYRFELKHHVTSRLLRFQPRHNWFWFAHSYSPQLVDKVLEVLSLSSNAKILDPFVGAGTTILRGQELGYHADGCDLSPLSVFVSKVKVAQYVEAELIDAMDCLQRYRPMFDFSYKLPQRLQRAFLPSEMAHFRGIQKKIQDLEQPERNFFKLALLRTQQQVSRACPDGGWFRWVDKKDQSNHIWQIFKEYVQKQINGLSVKINGGGDVWLDDARYLSNTKRRYDLVITSPPYPNRHDYSRVFHVELLSLGMRDEEVRELRHKSLRSHVEAKPPNRAPQGYYVPQLLRKVLKELPSGIDSRIPRMLNGYFEDMFMVMQNLRKHLYSDAHLVFVVGNVRHAGVMVPVDEILIEIGQQLGYTFLGAWVARLRGNSAQQMGRFGRVSARESIVFFRV